MNGGDDGIATSIKGVLLVDGGVVLVRNPRGEWELPGGRAEPGETPEAALVREFEEELAVRVDVQAPIDSYVFEVVPNRNVRIVTYGCTLVSTFAPRISDEHSAYRTCPAGDLSTLPLPAGYRQSIETWCATVRVANGG